MGNQLLDQKQLKNDQFTTNYSKFLENVKENQSGLSSEEYDRAKGLYNERTQSMKNGFKKVFNIKQNPEKVKHPDMTRFMESPDDVKLEKRMEKRGLLKSGVEVTNREEILGGKEVHKALVREESNKHRDMVAGFRRQLSHKLRAEAGDYDTLKCLSEFYPQILRESGDKEAAQLRFESLLKNYGGQSENAVENKKQRFEALDDLTEIIMKIDLGNVNLSSDEAIAMNAARLEQISAVASAFDRLLNKNPDYREELLTRKNGEGESLGKKLSAKMDVLLSVSDYYRVKKLLITDETYTKYLNSEIGISRKESDSFAMGRLKKLMRAAYYLGQNLAAKTRKGFMQVPLPVEENPYAEDYDELEAEDDAAVRLLSTDPSYSESFEKLKMDKVAALTEEKEAKEKEFQKAKNAYDSFMQKDGARVEAYVKDFAEKKVKFNNELYNLDSERIKLKEEYDYYSEEVKLIDAQILYEYNLTERERIDRAIYGLEAERLYVPQKWVKMSMDVPERNDDPDFIKALETMQSEYADVYIKNTGGTKVRNYITEHKEKRGNNTLGHICFNGLEKRYADPCFDSFDRIVDHIAGAYRYGFSDEEMLEQFDILADYCENNKVKEIKDDPMVKKYQESAYKEMVRRLHLQIYAAVQRIKNGLGDTPFFLMPIDILMQTTCMLRTELMAMCTHTNPVTPTNIRYVAQLLRDDPEGKCPVDMNDYENAGNSYSQVPFAFQSYLSNFYDLSLRREGYYTKKEAQKIQEYADNYKLDHPDNKLSDGDIYREYALSHPQEFNTRTKLLRICESDEAEEARRHNIIDKKDMIFNGILKNLQYLMKNKKIRLTDRKKLLEYEKKLKAQHPELALTGFKTDGVDDPFLIRRHMKNYELSPEEIDYLKDMKPQFLSSLVKLHELSDKRL